MSTDNTPFSASPLALLVEEGLRHRKSEQPIVENEEGWFEDQMLDADPVAGTPKPEDSKFGSTLILPGVDVLTFELNALLWRLHSGQTVAVCSLVSSSRASVIDSSPTFAVPLFMVRCKPEEGKATQEEGYKKKQELELKVCLNLTNRSAL